MVVQNVMISYQIRSLPINGLLEYNRENVSRGFILTDDDIRQKRLTYTHDDSETTEDNFTFIVHVRSTRSVINTSGLQDVMFRIDVTPVNDQSFVLHSGEYRII